MTLNLLNWLELEDILVLQVPSNLVQNSCLNTTSTTYTYSITDSNKSKTKGKNKNI